MTEWKDWGAPVRAKVEAGAIWAFARAVKDDNPAYAAGVDGTPAPPTFTFAVRHHGAFPALQTTPAEEPDFSALTARGGLYLHGEQEFRYHRTPVAGDLLESRTRTSVPQQKGTKEVTFYETEWRIADTGEPVVTETITSLWLAQPPA
jgi:hypothetical protein